MTREIWTDGNPTSKTLDNVNILRWSAEINPKSGTVTSNLGINESS